VDIRPLLSSTPGAGVAHLRLSAAVAEPVVVMTNGRAHLFSQRMRRWLRVVDGAFQASLHNTVLVESDADGAFISAFSSVIYL
jgi:hypothetical protein